MKEPPFRTVPTFVPWFRYKSYLKDQREKLLSVIELGLCFSLLGLAPGAGFEPATN